MTFSIDGATQPSYEKYRQRGRLDVALANLRAMADEKRRAGRDAPFLNWRYILFAWNDSDAEMNRARELAADIGVDRLCWEITDDPQDSLSRRFVPASADFDAIRQEVWEQTGLGNAIPGATPRARIEVRTLFERLPLVGRAGRRRLVRLGAQLCVPDGTVIDRDFARASLPDALPPGGSADVAIEVPAPERPGHYALKFDLVSEGIDWFERRGSRTTTKTLWVR